MKPEELNSEQKRNIIVDASEDKKANYISALDLRGKTLIADFFVICSGTSNIHIRSIADGMMEEMEKHGHRQNVLEGYSDASWILLDYGDVIAHIMSEEQRDFYKIERLWGPERKKLESVPDEELSAANNATTDEEDAE